MSSTLSGDEIQSAVRTLPGWRVEGTELRASFEAPDFPAAIALVDAVAAAAEQADHHPDIDIRWRTVHFACSTHSAGGLTEKDVALAREISQLAEAVPARVVT